MSIAKITILGLEIEMQYHNDSLFAGLTLPEGIDKEILVNTIMLDASEFEVCYPEPTFFKFCITSWGMKWYRTFDKWIKALNIEYNPLENYDRIEEWKESTDTHTTGRTDSRQTDSATSSAKNGSNNVTINHSKSDATNSVSAYDSNTFQPHDRNVTAGTNSVQDNVSGQSSGTTDGQTSGHAENVQDVDTDNVRIGRAHGNIGVQQSQEMLRSELDVARWNLYKNIADIFIQEFCILVY